MKPPSGSGYTSGARTYDEWGFIQDGITTLVKVQGKVPAAWLKIFKDHNDLGAELGCWQPIAR